MSTKFKFDREFNVFHPGLPTMASGGFSESATDEIHEICESVAQARVSRLLLAKASRIGSPGWLRNAAFHVLRTGEPFPGLTVEDDSEAGPDPDRWKLDVVCSNPTTLGATGVFVATAVVTEFERRLRDRMVRGKRFRVVTDMKLAAMHVDRAHGGPDALGYYDLCRQVLREELSWLSGYGIEPSALAFA